MAICSVLVICFDICFTRVSTMKAGFVRSHKLEMATLSSGADALVSEYSGCINVSEASPTHIPPLPNFPEFAAFRAGSNAYYEDVPMGTQFHASKTYLHSREKLKDFIGNMMLLEKG